MEELQSRVLAAYKSVFHARPTALATAPGRVNLIGEHIDYHGYSVLPMALRQVTCVAAGFVEYAARPACIQVHNVQPRDYPDEELDLDASAPVDLSAPKWSNYVHAAYKGAIELLERLDESRGRAALPVGGSLCLMVHSSIAPGAGLSSSSALVVASLLAILECFGVVMEDTDSPVAAVAASSNFSSVNSSTCTEVSRGQQQQQQRQISRAELADVASRCERYVGTQGGGMDQAASLLATAGAALHVRFEPLRAAHVQLPPGTAFVVANSLAPSHKAQTAALRFNLRVVESRMAALLLAKHLGCSAQHLHSIRTLGDVETVFDAAVEAGSIAAPMAAAASAADMPSSSGPRRLLPAVQQLLHEEPYSLQELELQLGMPCKTLFQHSLPQLEALLVAAGLPASTSCTTHAPGSASDDSASSSIPSFQLQQRALHVYSEAARALQFKATCKDASLAAEEKLTALGQLMYQSHDSCARLYQCSCPELDQLVTAARLAGALGARLTGAGWGGCIVALVQQERAEQFVQQLQEQYYFPKVEAGLLKPDELHLCCFVSTPSGGAAVHRHGCAMAR